MRTFCTIITADHYPRAAALFRSLEQSDPAVLLKVLVVDGPGVMLSANQPAGITLIQLSDLGAYRIVDALRQKYAGVSKDYLRWSLKPMLISYLLENGFEKVLYADCDICFFADPAFLFRELDEASILLTPHWWNKDPLRDEESFFSLFADGAFNAGFIGAGGAGIPALQWWAEACLCRMEPDVLKGIFVDQRYLDLLPPLFENVRIIRHKGCNIGPWNQLECKRILVDDAVLINGKYPVIFIHFNDMQCKEITKGHDLLLRPYFREYARLFEKNGHRLADFMKDSANHLHAGVLRKLKWKLLIRTRLKRLLFRLAAHL